MYGICGQVPSGGHQHHSSSASSGHSHSPGCGVEQLSKTNLYIRGLTPETKDHDLYGMCERLVPHSIHLIALYLLISCLQCFDAVGWVAGRASGL